MNVYIYIYIYTHIRPPCATCAPGRLPPTRTGVCEKNTPQSIRDRLDSTEIEIRHSTILETGEGRAREDELSGHRIEGGGEHFALPDRRAKDSDRRSVLSFSPQTPGIGFRPALRGVLLGTGSYVSQPKSPTSALSSHHVFTHGFCYPFDSLRFRSPQIKYGLYLSLSLYIYIYVYTCVYIYIYISYRYVCRSIYANKLRTLYIYIYIYMYIYIYIHMHISLHMRTSAAWSALRLKHVYS